MPDPKPAVSLRIPTLTDGLSVSQLIERCPPLDPNSSYCNFLQCGHFADTSVAAELGGDLVGFISGYRIPSRPETLFIWQVAVDQRARGIGLASEMLRHILQRQPSGAVSHLETTIGEANEASWALFRRLARELDADLQQETWLDCDDHFQGQHESEVLVRIGPF